MDIFVPWQSLLVQDCFNTVAKSSVALGSILPWKLRPTPAEKASHDQVGTEPFNSQDRGSSNAALAALGVIAALNLPAHIYFRAQYQLALIEAKNGLPGKIAGWTSYISNTLSQGILDGCVNYKWSLRTAEVSKKIVLSPKVFERNQWWTLISSSFVHKDEYHYQANMVSLSWFGPLCASVPGMGWKEMFGLAILSSLGAGVAYLLHNQLQGSWFRKELGRYAGFSGILYGIAVVSALGTPQDRWKRHAGFTRRLQWWVSCLCRWYNRIKVLKMIAADIVALVGRPRRIGRSTVAHAAHLGGAASGALFYYLVLHRPRQTEIEPILQDLPLGATIREQASFAPQSFYQKVLYLVSHTLAL